MAWDIASTTARSKRTGAPTSSAESVVEVGPPFLLPFAGDCIRPNSFCSPRQPVTWLVIAHNVAAALVALPGSAALPACPDAVPPAVRLRPRRCSTRSTRPSWPSSARRTRPRLLVVVLVLEVRLRDREEVRAWAWAWVWRRRSRSTTRVKRSRLGGSPRTGESSFLHFHVEYLEGLLTLCELVAKGTSGWFQPRTSADGSSADGSRSASRRRRRRVPRLPAAGL